MVYDNFYDLIQNRSDVVLWNGLVNGFLAIGKTFDSKKDQFNQNLFRDQKRFGVQYYFRNEDSPLEGLPTADFDVLLLPSRMGPLHCPGGGVALHLNRIIP